MLNYDYDYDYNYFFKEKKEIIKTSKYYYIDYQYMAINFDDDEEEEPYYGRTNRLKFKLCHDYCEKCYELGTSHKDQKCLSCLPEYQYNYLYFSDKADEKKKICVPKDYYYNSENDEMALCNSTNYFYINTNNKKICFKTEVNNLCPSSYPIYDEINHNCYSKNELYLSEMIKSFQSYITNEIDRTSIDNGNDLIISTDEMTYALTTTKNQLMKINEDITTIDLGECEYLLKKEYNISLNDSLYILKINLSLDGIQKVEYEVYYNFSLNDLTKLNLTVCENVKIDILIPKNISINDIDKYNKNSGYYNDICYTLTTDAGTDISLNDRRIEYQKNNLSICEEGCEFSGYNIIAKKVICSCYTKMNLPIITELKVDKQQLFSNFKDIRNIANFKMLKCIKLFFNKNNIFKNMSNYMMIILFILSIISIFIFAFYVYKKINEFLQIKKKKISIKLLSTNITTKNTIK